MTIELDNLETELSDVKNALEEEHGGEVSIRFDSVSGLSIRLEWEHEDAAEGALQVSESMEELDESLGLGRFEDSEVRVFSDRREIVLNTQMPDYKEEDNE